MKINCCPHCGGQIVVEYLGSYGDVYKMKEDGMPGKRRIKRFIYEHGGEDDKIIYCWECRKLLDE